MIKFILLTSLHCMSAGKVIPDTKFPKATACAKYGEIYVRADQITLMSVKYRITPTTQNIPYCILRFMDGYTIATEQTCKEIMEMKIND